MPPSLSPHPLPRTILLVVGDPAVRDLLAASLRHAGLFPMAAASAREGLRLAGEVRPDVLLIDMDAPASADASLLGLALADDLPPLLPVVLSARPETLDEALGEAPAGLNGAVVRIAKPFSPRELIERILRELGARGAKGPRAPERPARRLRAGPLEIDPEQHRASLHLAGNSMALELAPTELKVLRCLMEHPGRLLGREELLARVWGEAGGIDPRTVDQNIRRLRRCLQGAGSGSLIKTVRGLGYRLDIAACPTLASLRGTTARGPS